MRRTDDGARPGSRAVRWGRRAARFVVYVGIFIGIWEMVYVIWNPPAYLLPSIPAVLDEYKLQHDLILSSTGVTAYEILLGFLLAFVSGVGIAVLFDSVAVVRRVVWPVIVTFQLVPKIALAPWLVLIFGFGSLSKVYLAWIVAFFPVLIDTLAGLEGLSESADDLAKTMRLSRWQFYRYIKGPNALPQVFAGAKVGVTLAVIGAVVGELIASDTGLGHLMVVGQGDLSAAVIVVAIITLTVVGAIFYGVIEVIERLAIPWHVSQRRRRQAEDIAVTAVGVDEPAMSPAGIH